MENKYLEPATSDWWSGYFGATLDTKILVLDWSSTSSFFMVAVLAEVEVPGCCGDDWALVSPMMVLSCVMWCCFPKIEAWWSYKIEYLLLLRPQYQKGGWEVDFLLMLLLLRARQKGDWLWFSNVCTKMKVSLLHYHASGVTSSLFVILKFVRFPKGC